MQLTRESGTVQKIYVIRDTLIDVDIQVRILSHDAEAGVWFAQFCCALKRTSFELYCIGEVNHNNFFLSVAPMERKYMFSCSKELLDSYYECDPVDIDMVTFADEDKDENPNL